MLLRRATGYEVMESEGGHVDFAPLDTIEDQILVQLRRNFRRVSVERVASGRGLWNLYEAPKDSARLYSRIIASNGADLGR